MLCNVSCFDQGYKFGDLIKDGEWGSEELCNLFHENTVKKIQFLFLQQLVGKSLHWIGEE